MSATDYQGAAASSFASFGRSILSIGRDHVYSMESTEVISNELDAFQKNLSEKLRDLLNVHDNVFLSIKWIHMLLDLFVSCQGEFMAILLHNKTNLNRAPMDRYVTDHFERSVKALDVCNAIRDGIEQIRHWQKQLEIVLCALDSKKTLGEGQFRRAKKALNDLAIAMIDNQDSNTHVSHRNRSFGRNNTTTHKDRKTLGNFRSLSWSVSRSWSASKQLQAIGNNLTPPRANEVLATNGLAAVVFTMNNVLLFVMWALVAAIPCQDRGLQVHFNVPRNYIWAAPISSLHDRILEESRKRDRRNACGLLKEIEDIERCMRSVNAMADSCVQFPLALAEEGKEVEDRQGVYELGIVYDAIKNGLDPLETKVRHVFHKIVRSRTQGLNTI